ncbi:MAG: glycosyltransferase family 4 protein [Candidatus Bathyarchaeia archaeon]
MVLQLRHGYLYDEVPRLVQLLKVCIVTPSLYPLSIGGPANVTSYLIRELDKCGITLKIIFELPYAKQVNMLFLRNCMEIGEGPELVPLDLQSDWRLRIAGALSSLNLIAEKIQDVDLVHFQTYPSALPYFMTLLLTKVKHIPCALSYHGSSFLKIRQPGKARTFQEYLYLPYFFSTRCLFDMVIVPSSSMARQAELEGFKGEKVRVIPNGIDIAKFHRAKPKKLEGEPAILWVGYTAWSKGVDIALEMMRIVSCVMPSARLHFIGPYRVGFINELRKENLEGVVKVHGNISPLEMPSYYAGADICINPSRWESFSLVVLEAMAAGKAVVASKVGGMKELIQDKVNGLLVRPEANSFAEAILKLCCNINLRTCIARNAIERAKEFNWSNIISRYLNLYMDLIGDRSSVK